MCFSEEIFSHLGKQNNHVTPASPARSIDSLLFNISLLTQTVCFFKIDKKQELRGKNCLFNEKKKQKTM